MIQRIQSIFLVKYILFTFFLNFYFPIENTPNSYRFQKFIEFLPYFFVGIIIVNLFLFSKRKIQLKINTLVLLSSFVFEFYLECMKYIILNSFNELFSIRLVLVIFSWISLILANKFIRKDDDLIRSLDRLR